VSRYTGTLLFLLLFALSGVLAIFLDKRAKAKKKKTWEVKEVVTINTKRPGLAAYLELYRVTTTTGTVAYVYLQVGGEWVTRSSVSGGYFTGDFSKFLINAANKQRNLEWLHQLEQATAILAKEPEENHSKSGITG